MKKKTKSFFWKRKIERKFWKLLAPSQIVASLLNIIFKKIMLFFVFFFFEKSNWREFWITPQTKILWFELDLHYEQRPRAMAYGFLIQKMEYGEVLWIVTNGF